MKPLALSLFAMALATTSQAAERKAKIEVTELFCPSCPYIAAQAISDLSSVDIVEGKYDQSAEKAVFVVKYDDAETTAAEIAAAPEQYGYPGRVLEDAPQS